MESSERKIMIVEDEGLIAADLRGRLEKAGYLVAPIADSATDALRIIGESSPDLVLMDIRIRGDVDGIQAAEKVRQEFDLPVVYITAYEDTGTLERASRTQAFGYIKKPIASASLKGSIEMALAKHRHERYLREQREWFSASFAAVPHGVAVTDGSGRICYLNPAGQELTGWNIDNALGQASSKVLRFFYRNGGRRMEDFVPAAILQAQPMSLPRDLVLRDRENRSFVVEATISPRWRDGRIDGTVLVFKNVSCQRFEEEQLKQDDTQGALVRMAGGIAKRLDLEVGVMADESARLLDGLASDSILRDSAATIERAALDAFAVTCRLQTFARMPEINSSLVNLNDVLGRLELAWKRLLPTFTLHLEANPAPVQADAWQLTRALVSVLLHASASMQPATKVRLDVTPPEIEEMRDWVRIRVAYSTVAEDEKSLGHVFEPSWSDETEGLALAYRRIREMGGFMRAGLEGETVRFEIHLPRIGAIGAGAVREQQDEAILLIEPNPEVRRVLHRHFEQHGYTLLEADSCEEALLLAHLYEGPIPLAIAHPENGDWARNEVSSALAAIKPGIRIRLLAGYWEDCGQPGSQAWESTCRYLTKWDLLEWANRAIVSARAAAVATDLLA